MPKRSSYDHWLFFSSALLALAGLFMVGSASTYFAMDYARDPSAYLWKHLAHLVLAFFVLVGAMSFDYRKLADGRLLLIIVGFSVALLVLVLAMPASNGAHRWFLVGPLRFQPSELAKLTTVLFMAYLLSRKESQVNNPWAVAVPGFAVVGTLGLLVVIEPDLGSSVMLLGVAALMIFAAGLSWRYIAALGGVGLAAFSWAVIAEPYRWERIWSFFHPTADVYGTNFQLQQSLIALGRGGLLGTGFGHGEQKAFYLPAAHTDFIFSVIGEEVGLVGTGLLLLAFLLIFWRGLRAAVRAPDRFGFYVGLGVTLLIVVQALVNMAVCIGLLPTKGLPMPFISYGGSSLLISMAAVGLLLNVSQHSN